MCLLLAEACETAAMLLWALLLLLMSLSVVYEVSPRGRYCLRQAVLFGMPLVIGSLVTPLGLWRPCHPANSLLFVTPLKLVGCVLGLQWQLRGETRLKKHSACVVVANHQSAVDVLGMVQLWPRLGSIVSLIKKEVWLGFPFALASWMCGQIFIDRSNPARARESLKVAEKRMLDEKLAVWFFPEGTRNKATTGLLPFKKGAFHLAVSAQVPIYPVVFSSYRSFLEPARWKFGPGLAVATVLEPVETTGLTAADVPELTEKVRRLMSETFAEVAPGVASQCPLDEAGDECAAGDAAKMVN